MEEILYFKFENYFWGGYKFIFLISIVISFSIFGCAAREKLNTYPRRHIDRPFTLPKGINSWNTIISYTHYEDQDNDSESNLFPYPFIWNQPITDNLSLTWSPLPFTLQYQLINTEKYTAGISGGVSGLTYSSLDGWSVYTSISGYYKLKFNDSTAIENGLTIMNEFGDDDNDLWGAYFYTGPLFQVKDNLAIAPRFHLAVDRVDGRNYFFYDDEEFEQKETQCAFPLSLWIGWSLHKRLDLSIEYTYKALGYSNDFEGHEFAASIVHLW